MFESYLNDEQKQVLLNLSNELLALKAKRDPLNRNHLEKLEKSVRETLVSSDISKRPEAVFSSRKERFIALFELYKLAFITEKLSIEEESYLSFLGWRFRFDRSELSHVVDLAKKARSLEDNAHLLITGNI